jgi:hypothetical protein
MMQTIHYPQGEGGFPCRHECQPAAARRYTIPFYLRFTPLLSRLVVWTTRRQTAARKGVIRDGY